MLSNLLHGKKGIIFGALNEDSIAYQVALKAKAQGASIVLSNTAAAIRMGSVQALAEEIEAPLIACDITKVDEVSDLLDASTAHFGGKIDFVLHSIGMSINVRKKRAYTDLDHDATLKTLDISGVSFHKLLQTAYNKDVIADEGSVVALSYIAAQRVFPDYNEMAEAKAVLESIARSFGYHYGTRNKVRINTISQSPTMTTAGKGVKSFKEFYDYADTVSPLGNASASSCADYCLFLFSDLSKLITMQNLYHDGGFSAMGMTPAIFDFAAKTAEKEE